MTIFTITIRDEVFSILTPFLRVEYEWAPPDFQAVPYNYPVHATVPANTLVNDLLPAVGASLPYRDYADYYVVNEVKSFGKTGALIGSENCASFRRTHDMDALGRYCKNGFDNDGMPDSWESANGTNPGANDAMVISASGYTNIENYHQQHHCRQLPGIFKNTDEAEAGFSYNKHIISFMA
jgi:hypothetical protein